VFLGLAGLALAGWSAPAPAQSLKSFAPLVKEQMPRVVHIKTGAAQETKEPSEQFGPFRPPEFFSGRGTGFIVDGNGLIVTNYHVIQNSEAIEVVLSSEDVFKARVVGVDERTDLALIQIEAANLSPVRFGDSNKVEVGDWVIAIGDPLGLNYSVTAGIVSAKGRNIFDSENTAYGEFIQTDAAINPGNSGGPLYNLDGEVIGMNTAISSRGQGIGFAVPSNLLVEIVRQLKERGRVVRGWLGVVIQEIAPEWVKSVGLPERTRGILVNDIVPNAPASRSPLRKGDLIISLQGERLKRVPQLQKLVAFTPPGQKVRVEVLRREEGKAEWKSAAFDIEIGREPSEPEVGRGGPNLLDKLDITLSAVPEAARRRLGLQEGQGMQVERVGAGGLGQKIGLAVGDIILEAARREVKSRDELARILEENLNARIPILVQRDNRTLYLTLQGLDLK
jgi:serine protease Do